MKKQWTEQDWVDYYTQRILDDIQELVNKIAIPEKVASFEELHEHLDANELGGFCDDLHHERCRHLYEINKWTIFDKAQTEVDEHLKAHPTTLDLLAH